MEPTGSPPEWSPKTPVGAAAFAAFKALNLEDSAWAGAKDYIDGILDSGAWAASKVPGPRTFSAEQAQKQLGVILGKLTVNEAVDVLNAYAAAYPQRFAGRASVTFATGAGGRECKWCKWGQTR